MGQTYEQAVATVLSTAQHFIDLAVPYKWGGNTLGGADCSGMVQYCFGSAGLSTPHFTGDQLNACDVVETAARAPGDCVFYYGTDPDLPASVPSHVALYVGAGIVIEEAGPEGHPPRKGPVREYGTKPPKYARFRVLSALPHGQLTSTHAPNRLLRVHTDIDQLRLRVAPSVASASIRLLVPGEYLVIFGGPAQADGYRWWHVATSGQPGWIAEGGWTDVVQPLVIRPDLPATHLETVDPAPVQPRARAQKETTHDRA
jgi:hypothetical protein